MRGHLVRAARAEAEIRSLNEDVERRAWAIGEPGEGATFFFTLQEPAGEV